MKTFKGERILEERLSKHKALKIKAAYKHPWLKRKENIFNYYNDKTVMVRLSDLNIKDEQDFNQIKNLDSNEVFS